MANDNIWLECIRLRLRFPSIKGLLTVEDLFLLGLDDLNTIYKELDGSLKGKGKSLNKNEIDEEDLLIGKKLAIVESVYNLKESEIHEKEKAEIRSQKKDRIRDLIYRKENEELSNLSIDELKELLSDLE